MSDIDILVYITSNKEKVIGGNPLTLVINDVEEQKSLVREISIALKANVVQLKNGDYIIISK
jgi:predicted transcriptional regulator